MFTGIVEGTGRVTDVRETDGGRRFTVAPEGDLELDDLHEGQSIAVSGVCLTVEAHEDGRFEVFTAVETLERTYLGRLTPGDRVNVERALPAAGRFDGHLVQGHVDGTTTVEAVERVGDDWWYEFALPDGLERYVVEKGSVALDGISLTVAERGEATFGVAVVPTTDDLTTLGAKAAGDPVHVEVDVVAKYVESLVEGYR
ncbi:MAG: riboflavin synthase [Haloferacaceae archaeon]